jgi:hypothetical protein
LAAKANDEANGKARRGQWPSRPVMMPTDMILAATANDTATIRRWPHHWPRRWPMAWVMAYNEAAIGLRQTRPTADCGHPTYDEANGGSYYDEANRCDFGRHSQQCSHDPPLASSGDTIGLVVDQWHDQTRPTVDRGHHGV